MYYYVGVDLLKSLLDCITILQDCYCGYYIK